MLMSLSKEAMLNHQFAVTQHSSSRAEVTQVRLLTVGRLKRECPFVNDVFSMNKLLLLVPDREVEEVDLL